ncbi:hypothetical protein [Arthrobacter sp. SX1312]|uniref:hypothetical protein n=1 Tax=Arthrobacter sp. SX1312 TaxID=2058896 RepID=UPI000CE54DF1|nr:hypothetical protein [Arthrobacter sp. SX1312]
MAEAADSTTLFHPTAPGVTREREDKAEFEAHVEAGWLTEDPKVTADKEAEEAAETARRSEAARKGAETRKKRTEEQPIAAPGSSDAPVVAVVNETP